MEAANTTGEYGAQLSDKIAAVTDIQAVLTAKEYGINKAGWNCYHRSRGLRLL